MSDPEQKTHALSLRITPSTHQRIEEIAEKLKIKKHSLAIAAIESALDAIERNGYRLVFPIEFEVKHIAVEAKKEESDFHSNGGKKNAA
jgi:uncharacterized protein Yka (UPF0111/DUF47 family)